jgi:hypothetical protein
LAFEQELLSCSQTKNTSRSDWFAPSMFFLSNRYFVHISFPDSPNLNGQIQPLHCTHAGSKTLSRSYVCQRIESKPANSEISKPDQKQICWQ